MSEILSEGVETTALSPIATASRLLKLIAVNGTDTGLVTVGQVLDILVGLAPGALDTIYELAAASENNSDLIALLNAAVATKASLNGAETLTNKTLITPAISGVQNASNAAAGDVGEMLSTFLASGAALPFTTSVTRNILSMILSAGDWDVEGTLITAPAGGTITGGLAAGISLVSAVEPAPSANGFAAGQIIATSIAGAKWTLPTGRLRVNVPSITTVYLVATSIFSGGTLGGFGALTARRVR